MLIKTNNALFVDAPLLLKSMTSEISILSWYTIYILISIHYGKNSYKLKVSYH